MKILVPIKRVVDYNVKIRIKPDGSGIDLTNVKMSMNPFDEIAVEEAVRQKEAGKATDIVAVCVGPAQGADTLRAALAMGADRGILVQTDAMPEPLGVAKVLKKICEKETPSIVMLGKQASDDDANQTGQMLAALLDWPQATFVSRLSIEGGTVLAGREIERGVETLELPCPCVVTTDLHLNTPRYASLPAIMQSKRKPLDTIAIDTLGVDTALRVKTLKVEEPPKRKPGVMVPDIDTLLDKLRHEAKVIA